MAYKNSIDYKMENDLVSFSFDEKELVGKTIDFIQAQIDAAFGEERKCEISLMELSFGLQIIRKKLGFDNTEELKKELMEGIE